MSDFKAFLCPHHALLMDSDAGCALCVINFANAPDADAMTPDERVAEFDSHLTHVLTVPFETLHVRIVDLVGRDVFTHELGMNVDGLREECRLPERPRMPDMPAIIKQLTEAGVNVIVMQVGGDE